MTNTTIPVPHATLPQQMRLDLLVDMLTWAVIESGEPYEYHWADWSAKDEDNLRLLAQAVSLHGCAVTYAHIFDECAIRPFRAMAYHRMVRDELVARAESGDLRSETVKLVGKFTGVAQQEGVLPVAV